LRIVVFGVLVDHSGGLYVVIDVKYVVAVVNHLLKLGQVLRGRCLFLG
jgi:hypothetical protein